MPTNLATPINSLHPNGVFDTGIWTKEVTRQDVAEFAAALCEDLFSKTTGAQQIAVDGGNDRVI